MLSLSNVVPSSAALGGISDEVGLVRTDDSWVARSLNAVEQMVVEPEKPNRNGFLDLEMGMSPTHPPRGGSA